MTADKYQSEFNVHGQDGFVVQQRVSHSSELIFPYTDLQTLILAGFFAHKSMNACHYKVF